VDIDVYHIHRVYILLCLVIHIYTYLCWYYLGKGCIRHFWLFLLGIFVVGREDKKKKKTKNGIWRPMFPGAFIYISFLFLLSFGLAWYGLICPLILLFSPGKFVAMYESKDGWSGRSGLPLWRSPDEGMMNDDGSIDSFFPSFLFRAVYLYLQRCSFICSTLIIFPHGRCGKGVPLLIAKRIIAAYLLLTDVNPPP